MCCNTKQLLCQRVKIKKINKLLNVLSLSNFTLTKNSTVSG